jgi:hypothetical protein
VRRKQKVLTHRVSDFRSFRKQDPSSRMKLPLMPLNCRKCQGVEKEGEAE